MTDQAAGFGTWRLRKLLDADPADRAVPLAAEELAEAGEAAMDPVVRDFVAGGAGASGTVAENRTAFERYRLVPRMGVDVGDRDLAVELLGETHPLPLLLAPIGVQSLLHGEGERATARAAADLDVPLVLSTVASTSMEDVAGQLGDTPRWYQLYWLDHREVVESLVGRAEAAGYGAIVLTMDTQVAPWREGMLARGETVPEDAALRNVFADPVVADRFDLEPGDVPEDSMARYASLRSGGNATWADVEALAGMTDLPVLVKGVLRAADARRAVEHGAAGVIVSNHGGRQVEGSIAAIDALPGVVDAVATEVPVLFDSGIRRGTDALIALALGASAVLLGRPYLYGLAIAGEAGVREVIENVAAELDLMLGMLGYASIESLDGNAVVERPR